MPYSTTRPMGLTGLEHQNACRDRTPLLFPASTEHLCSSRHSPLLQLAAQRPSLVLLSVRSPFSTIPVVTLTSLTQLRIMVPLLRVPQVSAKSPFHRKRPYSRGLSEDAESLRFHGSIAHTHLSHLILHSWKAGTENDSCLEFQSFVSFWCGFDFVWPRSTLFITSK